MVVISGLEGDWRSKLQLHRQNLSFALATEDLNYVYIRSALAVQGTQSNPSLALMAAGAPDTVDAKIKDINADAVKEIKEHYESFSTEVEGLKASKPDEGAWKAKLEAKREELKKKSAAAIDKSFEAANNYIETMPKAQQDAAANIFSVGADLVVQAAEFIYGKIKEVIGAVVDFLRGIWDKVVTVYNEVKDFFSNIVGSITGVFNMPVLAAPASADNGLYEGSVTWKHSISLAEAAASFEAACDLLSFVIGKDNGPKPVYSVTSKFVNISGGKCAANVLFNVTEHAPQLGQHFKGLFENLYPGLTTSWTIRGEPIAPTPSPESKYRSWKIWLSRSDDCVIEPSVEVKDCIYSLNWVNRNQPLNESAVQATLDSLQSTISTTIKGKYIVKTGEIEKTRNFWVADIACRQVSLSEAPDVFSTMEKAFTEELGRKPNLFTFAKLEADVRTDIT
ncbi:hypothetical protein MMC18_009017 [Xylographa bjoerkii]|nr:hypothetical protein [Xylographa bjoerkii]